VESLLRVRTRLDAAKLAPLLADAARALLSLKDPPAMELGARLAGSFQLGAVEPALAALFTTGATPMPPAVQLAALRALRDLKSGQVDLFARLAEQGEDPLPREIAVAALAASRDLRGPQQLAILYPALPAALRKTALAGLSGTKPGAQALVKAIRSGGIAKDEIDGSTFDKLQAVLRDDADLAALLQEMASLFRPALRLAGGGDAWSETGITLEGPFTVETWVKLDPGIDNNDGILGAPGVLDMNFYGGQFRVWVGGGTHDAIVAKKKMTADVWTHLAVTRDAEGNLRLYRNGELDTAEGKPVRTKFERLRVGWTAPGKGTSGWLDEFRVWNQARTAEAIRADFDRSFANSEVEKPRGLVHLFAGTNWGTLHKGATVAKTSDFPALLTEAEAKANAEKFAKFHALAERSGDMVKGAALFTAVCQGCHSVGGRGGQIGPVLNGAGALGIKALLRNVLTPNAAMEPGYRVFRVEMKDGEVLDGILVSENPEAIVLRRPNVEDTRLAQKDVRKAGFTKTSMMPGGLLEALDSKDVTDLFAYLKTLK
jgi:putative heme-binding domain-containing protein